MEAEVRTGISLPSTRIRMSRKVGSEMARSSLSQVVLSSRKVCLAGGELTASLCEGLCFCVGREVRWGGGGSKMFLFLLFLFWLGYY